MENDRVLIGALIFILLVVGSNLIMYGIVRGATKGGDSHWMSALKNSFSKPTEGLGKPLDGRITQESGGTGGKEGGEMTGSAVSNTSHMMSYSAFSNHVIVSYYMAVASLQATVAYRRFLWKK
jgi:hypothetical protein